MSAFRIRRAITKDIPEIAFINAESWKTTYRGIVTQSFLDGLTTEQQMPRAKRLVDSSELETFVAVNSLTDEAFGFSCFGPNREKNVNADCELQAIYILESHQRQGVGQALFDEGVKRLRFNSKKRMMVSVFEANLQARKFYEKMGGQLIGSDHVDLEDRRYKTSTYLWTWG